MKKTIPGVSETDRNLLLEILPSETTYKPKRETLERLISMGATVTLRKGDNLIAAGQCDPSLYIIIDGVLRCWYWNHDKEETAYFSTIPTIFFNNFSYYAGEPSFYSYEACCDARIIKVSKQDFDKLLEESQDLALWMFSLANCQAYHYEIKARRGLGDARERYRHLLEEFPEVFKIASLGVIASYLKITPQYLSKIRHHKK